MSSEHKKKNQEEIIMKGNFDIMGNLEQVRCSKAQYVNALCYKSVSYDLGKIYVELLIQK